MNVTYNGNFLERFIDWADYPSYLSQHVEGPLEMIIFVFLFPFYWVIKIALIVGLFITCPVWAIPYFIITSIVKRRK